MPGIDYLSSALRRLAGVPSQVSKDVSVEIKKQIQKDFAAGVDPYGKPWAPLAPATIAKGRTPPPLTDTGKGLKNILAKPMAGAGVSVTSNTPYMRFHQTGTGKMPARPFIPYGPLPKSWADAIKKAADRRMNRAK